jgi:benzoate membrane transport protein
LLEKLKDFQAPAVAGLVATVTGMAASTGVVLAAFSAIGATQSQTASAVMVTLGLYGLLSILLSFKYRMPISIVWSTPGAALLISAGTLGHSFEQIVGAFFVCGILLALTGLWPWLGRLISSIPKSIAAAMLTGVIFSFCIAPFKSAETFGLVMALALVVWLVLYRFARVWAAPAAMIVIFGLTGITNPVDLSGVKVFSNLEFVMPSFDLATIIGVAIPLYIVTMAAQNIPGVAIMKSYGYQVPFRSTMISTGLATSLGSFFGGFSVNLAAISAAINANDHAHKDPGKRWVSSFFGGFLFLVLAATAGLTVAYVLGMPREVVLAAAGIALFSTITGSITTAVEVENERLPAIITFLVTASGVSLLGIGSAFWALLAGLVVLAFLNPKTAQTAITSGSKTNS